MKIGKKLCSDFLIFFLIKYVLDITKRNVHTKFQENRLKNVEARLKKPTKKIGENRLKNHVPIFGFFWLTNLSELPYKPNQ